MGKNFNGLFVLTDPSRLCLQLKKHTVVVLFDSSHLIVRTNFDSWRPFPLFPHYCDSPKQKKTLCDSPKHTKHYVTLPSRKKHYVTLPSRKKHYVTLPSTKNIMWLSLAPKNIVSLFQSQQTLCDSSKHNKLYVTLPSTTNIMWLFQAQQTLCDSSKHDKHYVTRKLKVAFTNTFSDTPG